MSAPTVTISEASYQLLKQLAEQTGQTTLDVLDKALESYRRRLFFEQLNAGYAELRADSGAWADHLAELAQTQPSEYKHPKLRADITLFGFITGMKIDEIVADQFGPGYLEQKVEWGGWGE